MNMVNKTRSLSVWDYRKSQILNEHNHSIFLDVTVCNVTIILTMMNVYEKIPHDSGEISF